MANHTTLPIYKVAYNLLDAVTDLAKNMPRDFKQSIGPVAYDVNDSIKRWNERFDHRTILDPK